MKIKGITLVFIGAACFGFTPIFVKTGFAYGYSLGEINIAQMLWGFILLWVLSLSKGLTTRGMTKADLWKVMATGTTVGLTSIFYYGAMQYLSASLAIILLFQFVWIGMIYEWVFSKSKPTRVNLISLAITLTGVVFASNVINGKAFDLPPLGLLLGLLSGFSYAGFIYFSGQVATKSHPILRSALMVTGSTILVLVVFFKDIPTYPLLDGRLWIIGAGVALVGAIIPPLFFAGGAPLISGRLANVLSSVELPVAIISAMLILSESVTWLQWFGILLILLAIVVNEMSGMMVKVKSRKRVS
ncbi:EamA family transporter [Halobacillus mangrovi]|uniref:Multidrug DMT transporter permease n=1 Tax=Halobacillus mangrovi TaxID=402384 RepID=A0A1W5ZX75_9BACI|nr:DMT family transporter [Halobacillus mangrovi]ARI77902.1 multidrug DMT transporter permease [Halobacillus mangrovi]